MSMYYEALVTYSQMTKQASALRAALKGAVGLGGNLLAKGRALAPVVAGRASSLAGQGLTAAKGLASKAAPIAAKGLNNAADLIAPPILTSGRAVAAKGLKGLAGKLPGFLGGGYVDDLAKAVKPSLLNSGRLSAAKGLRGLASRLVPPPPPITSKAMGVFGAGADKLRGLAGGLGSPAAWKDGLMRAARGVRDVF